MRRPTRLGLILAALLAVLAGGYTGYWFVVAGRIEHGVAAWAQSQRADKVAVSWRKLAVTGFPASFRIELKAVTVRDDALTPSPEFRIPAVSGTARPWNFADWRLAVREGFAGDIPGDGERAPAKLEVRDADGVISLEQEGGWKLWLTAEDARLDAISRILVNSADAWLIAPPNLSRQHTGRQLALAVNARQVKLPAGIDPLGNAIDELDFGAMIKGAIPNGRLPDALAAWRDAGGTVELDNLHVRWGPIDATASGTIAFDQALQPVGAFSGGLEGYDQILTALVQRGQMRPGDANLARIALAMLAEAGPDGKPRIKTAFALRDGQFFLGPARLGKAPRFTWE